MSLLFSKAHPRCAHALANPDLVARWKSGPTVNTPNAGAFYTPGPRGYTDYLVLPVAAWERAVPGGSGCRRE